MKSRNEIIIKKVANFLFGNKTFFSAPFDTPQEFELWSQKNANDISRISKILNNVFHSGSYYGVMAEFRIAMSPRASLENIITFIYCYPTILDIHRYINDPIIPAWYAYRSSQIFPLKSLMLEHRKTCEEYKSGLKKYIKEEFEKLNIFGEIEDVTACVQFTYDKKMPVKSLTDTALIILNDFETIYKIDNAPDLKECIKKYRIISNALTLLGNPEDHKDDTNLLAFHDFIEKKDNADLLKERRNIGWAKFLSPHLLFGKTTGEKIFEQSAYITMYKNNNK